MIFKRWKKHREEQQIINELSKLTDSQLQDIGINRKMLKQAVKAANKKKEDK